MKAKYFTKLRKKVEWYDVKVTNSLFGSLYGFNDSIRVLARNHKEAIPRAYRRGYGLNHIDDCRNITSANWAHWMVKKKI